MLHFHRVGRDMEIFIGKTRAGAAIEFPGVKRAGENRAVERTVAERAAGVRADAVDRVQSAIHIADGYRIAINIDLNCRARRQEF